jgi:hypothetical protein
MNPIIEKVALAILDSGEGCLSGAAYVDPHKSARAAIRATLEHLKEHPPEVMQPRGDWDYGDEERVFRSILSQAIAELDA